jgi:hypothetical protein
MSLAKRRYPPEMVENKERVRRLEKEDLSSPPLPFYLSPAIKEDLYSPSSLILFVSSY